MHIDRYKQGNLYVDKDGAEWDCAEDFLQGAVLGFCTCGNPWESLSFIRDVLRHVESNRDMQYEQWREAGSKLAEGRILYFAYYVLDEKGFLEHGGSVPGWLTDQGVELLEDLDELIDGDEDADTGHGATMFFQGTGAEPFGVGIITPVEEDDSQERT